VGESPDDIVGFVYAKDLLGIMDRGGGPEPVTRIMRPVYFVPETKRIPDLLRDMQTRQQHMAIVVDEFGGTAGLVTIEDLLEELVGEIVDEYDTEDPLFVEEEGGTYLVDGRFPVEDLEDALDVELPHDEWDTVGGLLLDLAGRVPYEGEAFEGHGIRFIVVSVQGRRVIQVRVTRSATT
ncbi:MAG TPA: CBS domain-containing protein, partial [Actinobacteria bacterium]|nr:CBS domain-containing protein [Actinomycetota bacterium]